jgi:hypothetical protein
MTTSTAQNALASPFLLLPAELRNRVYTYVFSDRTYRFSDAIRLMRPQSPGSRCSLIPKFLRSAWLGLIRTSRQINGETSLLPYLLNKFRVNSPIFYQLLDHLQRLRQPLTSLQLEVEAMVVSRERIFVYITNIEHLARLLPNVTCVEVTVTGLRQWKNWYCTTGAVRDPDYHTLHRYIEDALTVGSNGNIKVTILWDHGRET